MHVDQLRKIERANLIFGAAVTCLCGLFWGGAGMAAAGVGALLAVANFWAIRRLGARAVRRVEAGASGGQAVLLAVSLMIKMSALFALVWVAVRVLGLAIVPFSLGISVFVPSILVVGLGGGTTSTTVAPEEAR
jgi:hypothetical protein